MNLKQFMLNVKQINSRTMPVQLFRSGLVVNKKEPVLACSPDGKVIDINYTKAFGLLEVKSPETKFLWLHWRLALIPTSVVRTLMESVNWKLPIPTMHKFMDKWESQGQSGVTLWCSQNRHVSWKNCLWSSVLAWSGKKAFALLIWTFYWFCSSWNALRP